MNEKNISLKEGYYHTVARNLFLNQEFFKIFDALSGKNIPLIPLKGIALIQKIYPDSGSRYIGDIDLLVKAKDVPKATNLLQELGYSSPSFYFNPEKPYSIFLNSLPFSKPAQIPYFVHLHWHLLNSTLPLFMYGINMKEIWQAAESEMHQNREILMVAPHHLIIYLSIHAFKHSFNKISLFHDIQKSIQFYRDKLDWKVVSEVARDWGATLPLYYSLYFTSKILKVDDSTSLTINPERSRRIDSLEDILNIIKPEKITKSGYRMISSISEDKPGTHNLVFPLYFDIAGTLLNKIKFIFLSLFPPPNQLCQIYSINSRYLVLLYYLRRLGWGLTQFISFVKGYRL